MNGQLNGLSAVTVFFNKCAYGKSPVARIKSLLVTDTVLSVNEYTSFEKYHFKQYLNEHKNNLQNVEYT